MKAHKIIDIRPKMRMLRFKSSGDCHLVGLKQVIYVCIRSVNRILIEIVKSGGMAIELIIISRGIRYGHE